MGDEWGRKERIESAAVALRRLGKSYLAADVALSLIAPPDDGILRKPDEIEKLWKSAWAKAVKESGDV